MPPKFRLIDIARKANVSLGTVDRVVNKRGKVAAPTQKKILDIIDEFGYQTNLMASSLSSKKKITFAVLIPKPQGEDYWNKILIGIRKSEKQVLEFGVEIMEYLYEQDDDIKFNELASQILEFQFDGVLFAPVFEKEAKAFVFELGKRNIPCLFIDSMLEGTNPICSISQDIFQSGVLAAKLINYGLNTEDEILCISILMIADNFAHGKERSRGFKSYFEIKEPGKRLVHSLEIINPKFDEFSRLLKEKLIKFPKISGIFIDNSKAHWVARFLHENNISSIRLIGYDLIDRNIKYLQNGIIDFILFDQVENQGEMGLQILFDFVVKKKIPLSHINMPLIIVTRENLDGFLLKS